MADKHMPVVVLKDGDFEVWSPSRKHLFATVGWRDAADFVADAIGKNPTLAAAPQTAAERDRLAQEVERLSEVNAEWHEALTVISCPAASDKLLWWQALARTALAKAEEQS